MEAIKTVIYTMLVAASVLVLVISLPLLTIVFSTIVVIGCSYLFVKLLMYDDEEEGEQ